MTSSSNREMSRSPGDGGGGEPEDNEDDIMDEILPERFRKTTANNSEPNINNASERGGDPDNNDEIGSEFADGSVVSSITDRYGFLTHNNPEDPTGSSKDIKKKGRKHREDEDGALDVDILRRRESKWCEMLSHWDFYMMKHYKKIRERCWKGIPASIRPRAWINLCGAKYEMEIQENKTAFKRLYNQKGDEQYVNDIEKDLHRNFPTHEMFGGVYERIGQTELFLVLKAYSVMNPVDGYCQAQAPLAALLLMNMPSEQAFWCLVAICDKYIPGYYSHGLEAIQLDGDILLGLLKKVDPAIHKHLVKQEITPVLFMTEWFLCIYARTLPWACVMRIWDMFMCEGVKVLFRVGLVLIKFTLSRSIRKNCPSMYETLDALKNIPEKIKNEEFLVEQVIKLPITEEDMEREHRKQLHLRRKAQSSNNTPS